MHINVGILIIGSGYSGLIAQKKLQDMGEYDNIIVDKGFMNGYSDSDYVIFTKKNFPFTEKEIKVNIHKNSSGHKDFDSEYISKVYNRNVESDNIQFFSKDSETVSGFTICNEFLNRDLKCYGNVDISEIDVDNKTARGKILNLNENVTIKYRHLISTIPIHRFDKIVSKSYMQDLFISYFPIGIKKFNNLNPCEDMEIFYESDPDIPYYRKQVHGDNIFYEYSINRPMKIRFDHVVVPGKFCKVKDSIMEDYYGAYQEHEIYFAGRFATWDTDFLLDQIWETGESISNKFLQHLYEKL